MILGVESLEVKSASVAKYVAEFWFELYDCLDSPYPKDAQRIIVETGNPAIVLGKIIQIKINDFPLELVSNYMDETIHKICQHCWDMCAISFSQVFDQVPNNILTNDEKQSLIAAIQSSKTYDSDIINKFLKKLNSRCISYNFSK